VPPDAPLKGSSRSNGICSAYLIPDPQQIMKLRLSPVILATAFALYATVANAISILPFDTSNLAALSNGGSLTVGDKTFSNFSFTPTNLTSFNAAGIVVTASIAPDGTYLLNYGGNIEFASTTTGGADLVLSYRVTANPGQISMIDQSYVGSAQVFGGVGFLSVDESANVGGQTVANSHLQIGDISDPPAETTSINVIGDNLFLTPPQSVIDVIKDIHFGLVFGQPDDVIQAGDITISSVTQSFHQVPDGGLSVSLLGFALLGLEGIRRRLRA
jgi:hypothetical protein